MNNSAIVAELKRIADEHGGILHPADVVLAAQPLESVLHSRFEWNDDEAAHSYRLWQARQLIRVTVEMIGRGDSALSANVFVSLTNDRYGDGGYRSMVSVLSDPSGRRSLLADALAELKLFQEKYRELQELAAVFEAIDKAPEVARAIGRVQAWHGTERRGQATQARPGVSRIE